MFNFHVSIIGGGVIGSAIARELSKYKINVIVFEMGSDGKAQVKAGAQANDKCKEAADSCPVQAISL